MPDSIDIQGDTVRWSRQRLLDLRGGTAPKYPETLLINPESYNIYLPANQLHPVSDMKAALERCKKS